MFQVAAVVRGASHGLRRVRLLSFAPLCVVAAAQVSPQAAFMAENEAAMSRMMAGMDVKPSGNVDRDFAAMMIPHHQGAIDMAQAELRYGHDERLRRLAQEIVVSQTQEIAVMRMAMDSLHAPDDPGASSAQVFQRDGDSRAHAHH
jgi:hypothetical protein